MHNIGFKIFENMYSSVSVENFGGLVTDFTYIVFPNCGVGWPDHCLLGCGVVCLRL
jgi:hypothetical protein